MRRAPAVVVIVGMWWAMAPVAADVAVDLRAKDPVAGLPVVSANKLNFLRAYRRWKKGCKGPDIFVEDGGIDASVEEPQYSSTPLVGGCGEAVDAYEGNVNAVNESMRGTKCSTAGKRGQLAVAIPGSFEADGMHVDVTATSSGAHVAIRGLVAKAGSWVGGRRMGIKATSFEVRAWYAVDTGKRREVAVLLAGKQPDGTIAEKWMEVWAVKAPAKPSPIDTARAWLLAYSATDADARGRLEVASCCTLAEKPARYAELYDEQEFTKVTAKQIPSELAASAKQLAKLASAGHTLIQFSTDDARGSVVVVLAVKAGKVAAVFESANAR